VVPAGTVVTTGAWAGMLPAQRGDEVSVVFDGIGRAVARL
jgi:2-keto-4-pentenoate hydratase